MLQNNVEMDLKMRLIESGQTQTEVAEKLGVSLSYVNRITKGREQIVNKTFVKMMDELGYDVEITYKKKGSRLRLRQSGFIGLFAISSDSTGAFDKKYDQNN